MGSLLAAAWVLCSAARSLGGTIVLNDDTTIDALRSYPGAKVRVVQSGISPTTVDLVSGGAVSSIVAEDNSVVNLLGGTVSDRAQAKENASLNIAAGSLDGRVEGEGYAALSLSGDATVDALRIKGDSVLSMTGGTANLISVYDRGQVNVLGGVVQNAMVLRDLSVGVIEGGVVGSVQLHDSSALIITGGSLGSLSASDSTAVTISGGSLSGSLLARDKSTIEVYGYGLALTDGMLSGWLQDGSPIQSQAYQYTTGSIVLHNVPEPSCWALLASCLVMLLSASAILKFRSATDPCKARLTAVPGKDG
jgi:hypothetical protein